MNSFIFHKNVTFVLSLRRAMSSLNVAWTYPGCVIIFSTKNCFLNIKLFSILCLCDHEIWNINTNLYPNRPKITLGRIRVKKNRVLQQLQEQYKIQFFSFGEHDRYDARKTTRKWRSRITEMLKYLQLLLSNYL